MADITPQDRLDRHALVMAIWAPAIFIAAILLHKGLQPEQVWWIGAGFAVLIAGFCGHVIVNAVLGTGFSSGERALGIFAFAAALLAFLVTLMAGPSQLVGYIFLPVGLGMMSLVLTVVVYMLIAFGPRGAFEGFDVIRDNNLRPASRLPHRGGRR